MFVRTEKLRKLNVKPTDGTGTLSPTPAKQTPVVPTAVMRRELASCPQTFAGTVTRAVPMDGVDLKEAALAAPMVRRY